MYSRLQNFSPPRSSRAGKLTNHHSHQRGRTGNQAALMATSACHVHRDRGLSRPSSRFGKHQNCLALQPILAVVDGATLICGAPEFQHHAARHGKTNQNKSELLQQLRRPGYFHTYSAKKNTKNFVIIFWVTDFIIGWSDSDFFLPFPGQPVSSIYFYIRVI